MDLIFLSGHIIIFSRAYSKSSIVIISLQSLAAFNAASLTKFAKSAPTNPAVLLASQSISTSFAIFLSLR
jgi:hypothetical protein